MTSTVAAPMARSRSGRFFFLGLGLAMVAAVVVGFGRTIEAGLIHPPSPRPWILHVHVALFSLWLVIFISQALLARARRMRWHRRLGYAGAGLGTAMVVVGVATAIIMTRLHAAEGGPDGATDLVVPLFDMLAFAVLFALAIKWRFEPEYHRRLILMASCGLTAAAFGRFPHALVPAHCWYIAVDMLILTGAVRDLVTMRRIHPVYAVGIPVLALGQAITMWVSTQSPLWWITIAHTML